MATTDRRSSQTDGDEFVRRLSAAMLPLQLSLKSLHGALGRPKNTVAMQRQLGVGNTICWQVSRIVHADSLVSAARHAPLPQATGQFLEAAERVGVSRQILTDVRAAAEDFRGFMREHADDQASFDTLIAGVSGDDGQDTIQVRHRRAAYRAESHIWGFQRDAGAMIAFVRKSDRGDAFDVAVLLCQVGYRRLRPEAAATVASFGDVERWDSTMRPLDAEAMRTHRSPLVPGLCSDPIPVLERVPLRTGALVYRLADASLGRGGSKDLTFGVFCRDPAEMVDGRPSFSLSHALFCPTGRVILSLFVDRASCGPRVPTAVTRLSGFGDDDPRGRPLPMHERVLPLGPADRVPACDGFPKYHRALRYVAEATGWGLDRFDAFQLAVDFPIFASQISLSFPVD